MKSIAEIKQELLAVNIVDIPEALEQYRDDTRAGVINLVKSYDKKYAAHLKELERLDTMLEFERKYYKKGVKLVAGIDEVGRGPLAGPVVAAAVILPENCVIEGLDDSKKLSPKKREELYDIIMDKAVAVGLGAVDNRTIDRINILQATYMAMQGAIKNLKTEPEQLLVDAVTIPNVDIPQEAIVKGDSKSLSIAAASVIAKVTRDRFMTKIAEIYNGYDFENNMGYGTPKHYEGIRKLGFSAIHRMSFCKDVFNE